MSEWVSFHLMEYSAVHKYGVLQHFPCGSLTNFPVCCLVCACMYRDGLIWVFEPEQACCATRICGGMCVSVCVVYWERITSPEVI